MSIIEATDALLWKLCRFETITFPGPPLTVHIMSAAEITTTPMLADLAEHLPPELRLIVAQWSDGAALLTACPKAVPIRRSNGWPKAGQRLANVLGVYALPHPIVGSIVGSAWIVGSVTSPKSLFYWRPQGDSNPRTHRERDSQPL